MSSNPRNLRRNCCALLLLPSLLFWKSTNSNLIIYTEYDVFRLDNVLHTSPNTTLNIIDYSNIPRSSQEYDAISVGSSPEQGYLGILVILCNTTLQHTWAVFSSGTNDIQQIQCPPSLTENLPSDKAPGQICRCISASVRSTVTKSTCKPPGAP